MGKPEILIVGARQHNLKNITVRIPRGSLTVVTGLSGSGKSSLAFDTLYAEGQRKYVESLSAYARQFLEQMQKPDVDNIEGLSPAISIEQRTAGGNPRSIVATTTEIHDYLRLLFASIGRPHCPQCGRPIGSQSAEMIVEQLLRLADRTRIVILAPLVRGRKGRHADILDRVRRSGFVRVRIDGQIYEVEDVPELNPRKKHTIEVVVDRLEITRRVRPRLADSVETALAHGEGLMGVLIQKSGGWEERLFSEKNACPDCGVSFETLTPRHFSFNSPYGACPTCHGLGSMEVFDEGLVVPDPDLSLEEGAIHAWRRGGRRLIIYYKGVLRAVARHYGIDMYKPYRELPAEFRRILMYGSGDEEIEFGFWRGGAYHRYSKPFEGVIPNLERRYEQTESDAVRQRLRSYMRTSAWTTLRWTGRAEPCRAGRLSVSGWRPRSVRVW